MTSPKHPPGTSIGPADPRGSIDVNHHRTQPRRTRAGAYSNVDRWANGDPTGGISTPPVGGHAYDPSKGLSDPGQGAASAFSPVALALAEARRRRMTSEEARRAGGLDPRQNDLTAARDRSSAARYTASGKRISDAPAKAENIFDQRYTQGMKDAAQTVFDALNMDAITSDHTYNVGVNTIEKANPWEGKDSGRQAERRARAGVKPVGATEQLVQNTIAGGLADFQRMSHENPDMYNAMVYRLWSAGLISGKLEDAGLGGWTPKAGKALANAMSTVSQLNGQHIPTTLDEYVDSLSKARGQAITDGGGGSGGGGSQPAPRQYTSRDELNARLKSTAQDVLGRSLSDEEANKFAAAFHGTEDAAYNSAEAGKNYENPNAPAAAQAFVETGNQTEAASFRIQGFMERLKQEMNL